MKEQDDRNRESEMEPFDCRIAVLKLIYLWPLNLGASLEGDESVLSLGITELLIVIVGIT